LNASSNPSLRLVSDECIIEFQGAAFHAKSEFISGFTSLVVDDQTIVIRRILDFIVSLRVHVGTSNTVAFAVVVDENSHCLEIGITSVADESSALHLVTESHDNSAIICF
jgi:hypothetical protein